MAIVYLEPSDFTAAQAQRVLAFLNTATAQEIAARVEIPNEVDIGLRLAKRIVKARKAAGGSFKDLTQVADIPLIGPERFTELCVCILGLAPPKQLLAAADARRADQVPSPPEQPNVAAPTIELRLTPAAAFTGQVFDASARLVDARGVALPGRWLTLECGAGAVLQAGGYRFAERSALRVQTGTDGSAHFSVKLETLERLTIEQEAALLDALNVLDVAAASPNLVQKGLISLVQRYQSEREQALREAIDILTRQYRAAIVDRQHAGDFEFRWLEHSVVVRAHAHATGNTTVSSAVAIAAFKNWLGPFLEALRGDLERQADLGEEFKRAKRRGTEGQRLVNDLLGSAHRFVGAQRGFASELLSRQLVEQNTQRFLSSELEGIDASTRQLLFSQLRVAAEQLRASSRGTLEAIAVTREQVDDRISKTGTINQELLQNFEREMAGFNQRYTDFQSRVGRFSQDYATFRTDLASFNNTRIQINTDVGTLRTQFSKLEATNIQLTKDLTGVRHDIGTINEKLGTR